jgi:CRP/FNR family transcriptional regulator, dissimilatory nitrate respiration regulator
MENLNPMDLKLCPICGNIPENEREPFYQSLHAVTKSYAKGDFVARQGDKVGSLYLLSKGSVKTEMITESGGVLSVETIVAPRPLAPAFLFAENNRFPVDVVALEPCEVVTIPKTSVMQQLATNENFLKSYMTFNANRTQFLSERLQLLSIKTIKGKLAYYIRQRAVSGIFKLDRNQTELAEYFGVARPSLARSFSEMVDEGTITRDGKIVNADKLKQYILNG